jgi:hypothetical protein
MSVRPFLLIMLVGASLAQAAEAVAVAPVARLRAESVPLSSGAKLITFFERLPEGSAGVNGSRELPLMSILKDTLGDSDPSHDRIRQVWVFTYSRPSIWQRIAGGIPFLYHRAGLNNGPGQSSPHAVVDLGDPSHGMWTGLTLTAVQSEVLNPIGALARLTTHSFFGNYGEYRQTHIWEAADSISTFPGINDVDLTADDVNAVTERLELTGRPLGGLVTDEYLQRAEEKQRARQTETRGHNWDLLRQRAEEIGLYLQPLQPDGRAACFVLLWVAQRDLENPPTRSFDGQFLNISNPFSDERLRHWNGYSETWQLDRDGVRVPADAPEGQPVRMIPLALYALDHPRAPLLVVDFRRLSLPQRREIGLKIAEDATSGVLGLTGYGNLGYVALKTSWMFTQTRHGGATNRAARRRAFVEVRHALGTDLLIEPALRTELLSRIEKIDVNPIEGPWDQEVRDAWRQYNALIAYASETGLAREIDKDRGDELLASRHGTGARMLFRLASIGTVGIYRHHEPVDQPLMVQLDQQRRTAWLKLQAKPLPPVSEPILAGGAGSK